MYSKLYISGYAGIERFGTALDMHIISVPSYVDHLDKIAKENHRVQEEILSKACQAVREAHEEVDPSLIGQPILDLVVSFDGSWPKRGHSSLFGFAAVIDLLTGLVVDFIILCKHCRVCAVHSTEMDVTSDEYKNWLEQHVSSGECEKNYSGSSNAMEMVAAETMWKRSVKKNGFRYTSVLSDGDAKTHSHLQKEEPYGPNIKINKEECVNHVEKRLGTALRNLVATEKAKKVVLGGRAAGALKDTTITTLQSYYRMAIKNNMPDVKAAKNAILATIEHMSSTDLKPKHKLCPKGEESWCFYNKAKAKRQKVPSHNTMSVSLNSTVYEKLKPVYVRLSSDELLNRCSRIGTQNANESLHSLVWRRCPKELFMSRRRYEIGATRAVGEFNMGRSAFTAIKSQVRGEEQGQNAEKIVQRRDLKRKCQSELQKERTSKKARKKVQKKKADSKAKKKEGPTYAPGGFL